MTTLANRYFGESRYKEAKKIEVYRERERTFSVPEYFVPMTKGLPKAEKGLCGCGHEGKWYEFVFHSFP
jgi:hypothetical protein